MNKVLWGLVLLVVVGLGAWFLFSQDGIEGQYDEFAQCLSEKGIVMYGADSCSYCQEEKKTFGNSFQYVEYVECPETPQLCLEKGIKGYPTWIMKDGRKLVGERGLQRLSLESGCILKEE